MSTVDEIKCFITAAYVPDATIDQLPADRDLLATRVLDERGLRRLLVWVGARYSVPVDTAALDELRTVNDIHRFVAAARLAALSPAA